MRKLLLIAILAVALVVSVLVFGVRRGVEPTTADPVGPILVLGIDGAEWNVIQPLLSEGKLPNLASLIEEGATGRLRSLDPRRRSPIIWTTIATGKPPEDHGVGGAQKEVGRMGQPDVTPFSANMWRRRAFWDILGDAGLRVGVVAWLVTWPAGEVNGLMVSDHVHYINELTDASEGRRVTYPSDLADRIGPLVRTRDSVTDAELGRFVDLASELGLESLEGRNEYVLRNAISGDETAVGVTLAVLGEESLDLTCVYMRGVDEVCHRFWSYTNPKHRPPLDPEDEWSVRLAQQAEALEELISKYYAYADQNIGRILEVFPENVTVIVCSDHGFRGPGEWGQDRLWMGVDQHSLDGIVIMKGPGIAEQKVVEGATVHDIAPTLLAIAGAPIGRDMPGRVLTEAFTDDFSSGHPVRYVETHEIDPDKGEGQEPVESPVDDHVRERLRSLGYIE